MSRKGQYFGIQIKKEYVDMCNGKPPVQFWLWAEDRESLIKILKKKHILPEEIVNIEEGGAEWDTILTNKKESDETTNTKNNT